MPQQIQQSMAPRHWPMRCRSVSHTLATEKSTRCTRSTCTYTNNPYTGTSRTIESIRHQVLA